MASHQPVPLENFPDLDAVWPHAHAWAIDQMPGPAYCCSITGAILHSNAAAQRMWGGRPHGNDNAMWDGFASLRDVNGEPIPKSASPCAMAATGSAPPPTEQFASANDGQMRRVIVHAKPIADGSGTVIGVLCCLTDISEKRRLQERVREVAGARDEFLDMLAHELRNPLAPIMSAAGFLQRANVDPNIAKIGGVVERQAKQLARFIVDLLDASRVDSVHELPVEPRPCTGHEVVTLALDAVEPAVRARGQRLRVDVDDGESALRCDPERVAQALGNVLSNASAFSPDGEELRLLARIDGHVLRLEVADRGAGIAPEDLAHVFEPFERRAVAPGRAPGGAGLGLTIAKGVCEAHGGSIHVCSAGLGHGTTVSLTLPVAAPHA
jgi:signal transduction histidine kinase